MNDMHNLLWYEQEALQAAYSVKRAFNLDITDQDRAEIRNAIYRAAINAQLAKIGEKA